MALSELHETVAGWAIVTPTGGVVGVFPTVDEGIAAWRESERRPYEWRHNEWISRSEPVMRRMVALPAVPFVSAANAEDHARCIWEML